MSKTAQFNRCLAIWAPGVWWLQSEAPNSPRSSHLLRHGLFQCTKLVPHPSRVGPWREDHCHPPRGSWVVDANMVPMWWPSSYLLGGFCFFETPPFLSSQDPSRTLGCKNASWFFSWDFKWLLEYPSLPPTFHRQEECRKNLPRAAFHALPRDFPTMPWPKRGTTTTTAFLLTQATTIYLPILQSPHRS